MARRLSVPFSITILSLMALIVVPLSSMLLWLGWRAVDEMEQRDIEQGMSALDDAVVAFLGNSMRLIVSVGLTLGEEPVFAPESGPSADNERLRQLAALLRRHPVVDATFVGYPDGRMLYVGRTESYSLEQRKAFSIPAGDPLVERVIEGEGAERREVWRFLGPDGVPGEAHSRQTDFDPRNRPWYVEALAKRTPTLTEPYRFAWSSDPGLSVGVPMVKGGVIGFDASLGTLSRLIVQYKLTANSIILVSAGSSTIFIETMPCDPTDRACLPGDAEVRALVRRTVVEAAGGRVQRDAEIAGRAYKLIVHPVPPIYGRPFAVAAAVPLEELTVTSRALLERAGLIAAGSIGLAIVAVMLVSFVLSRSIGRMALKTQSIRNLDFTDTEPVRSRITEMRRLSEAVEHMREGLQVFGHYVSKDLVRQIMRSPASTGVGGERRDVTVMFTDIEGFSRISEDIAPELLTSRLSRYFEALGGAISANRGMIDKYIGDSVMAFWNAPELDPDHVFHAVTAALQANAASHALAVKWRGLGRAGFRTRFGLHAGPALVGNVGARDRINYTLVGAVANQASRLEGLNKVYHTDILASGEVAARTAEQFVWRHVDRIVAAGTTEALEIYEPLGEAASASEHAELLRHWSAGRQAYVEGRFEEAIGCFKRAEAQRPGDGPCRVFIARCTEFARTGLPAGWDGAWHYDRK
jgi:adenylate cyclase